MNYDTIYYWSGGTENGQWREAEFNVWPEYLSLQETLRRIRAGGHVAHHGWKSIGPPEGPPSIKEIQAAGNWNNSVKR